MATVEWTDARLNDAFAALRADNAQLREEMREEMRALRGDMNALADRVHADLRLMWVTIITTYASFVAAFVATQL